MVDAVDVDNRNIVKFARKANVFITFGNINKLTDGITHYTYTHIETHIHTTRICAINIRGSKH